MNRKSIPFRPDMAVALLEGRKTMTTRTEKYDLGEYPAWSKGLGTFATIRVTDAVATNWLAVTTDHFREEGFSSPEAMDAWCKANGLGHYARRSTLYRHTFEVVKVG